MRSKRSAIVHDDAMHTGSSKRDTALGVAGLDTNGHLLSKGSDLKLPRDVSNDIAIFERTSTERSLKINRVAANDYDAFIWESSAWKQIQTASMKNIASGIAGLNASGDLELTLGSTVNLKRNGSDNVFIGETTSAENILYAHRNAQGDYDLYLRDGDVWVLLNKNVASGIPGLDANVLLSSAQLPLLLEEYSNHLGAVDNFTQTVVSTGTATADATNHEMDLDSGNGADTYANFASKKTFTLSTAPLVISFLIQNLANGTGSNKLTHIGLLDSLTSSTPKKVCFTQGTGDTWFTETKDVTATSNAITALASGDIITIVATTTSAKFYVNGTLVNEHTTNIPTAALYLVGRVHCTSAAGTSRQASIDMMSIKKYS